MPSGLPDEANLTANMRSARNQLILLGLICQGLSWDNYLFPLMNVLIWTLCLTLPRKPIHLGSTGESLAILFGIALGYGVSHAAGVSSHFAIGHGLTMIQAVRLMRPLSMREKMFSLIAAFIHLGVGYAVVMDYRFLLILFASIILIPRALAETASDPIPGPKQRKVVLGGRAYACISLVALVFFLVFPRNFFGTPLSTHRSGSGEEGTLADTIMDPSSNPSGLSDRILMQIEGENVGYLRCIALDRFDGHTWSSDGRVQYRRVDFEKEDEDLSNFQYRRVRVKHVGYLSKVLPMDGRPVHVKGKFFRNLRLNIHDITSSIYMWNTSNNIFEYWTRLGPQQDRVRGEFKRRLLEYPEQSDRLKRWLEEQVQGISDPYEQARKVEAHLQETFTYKLGTPELNRLDPVDDFVFNQREGHCERFASTLTLLLRMKGIPARVMIGYVPGSRSWFSKGYSVRFKDAHAWTEAWFEDRGWVTMDATPRASLPLDTVGFQAFMEGFEFAWYLHVVNFGAPTQRLVFEGLSQSVHDMTDWVRSSSTKLIPWVVAACLIATSVLIGVFFMRKHRSRRLAGPRALRVANHLYGRMLKYLAKRGAPKRPGQTPFEYLADLQRTGRKNLAEVELITQTFCRSRYGHEELDPIAKKEMEAALTKIKSTASL